MTICVSSCIELKTPETSGVFSYLESKSKNTTLLRVVLRSVHSVRKRLAPVHSSPLTLG